MSSALEKEIGKIELLVYEGKLKEAHKRTKELLKKDNLTKEIELQIVVIQSEILTYFAKYPDSLKLSEKVLNESEAIDNNLLKADAYLQQALSLYNLGKFKESQEASIKGLELIEDAEKYDLKHVAQTKILLLASQGTLALEFGDFPKGLELFKAAYKCALDTKLDYLIAFATGLLGQGTYITGEYEKGEKYVDSAMEIAQSIGKHLFLLYTYFTYATVKQLVRKFDTALEYHQKGIEFSMETGAKIILYIFYSHSALIYSSRYNLDKALEYNNLALEVVPTGKYILLQNTGSIYLMKNEIEKAHEYFQNGLANSRKTGEIRVRPGIIYHLVLTSLLKKDLEQAEKYLLELDALGLESDYKQITQYQQLAKILILKESTRIQDWFEAIEILEKLLADEKLHISTRIDALFHLVEIRLKELQVTADQEILTEVKKQIEIIQEHAEENKQFNLLANLYRLKSQLALVELDAKKAVELLITAKTLAEEKNLQMIASNIREEQAKLDQQQNMWNRLTEQKAPLKDTLKEVHLDNRAKQLANETIVEVRDERTGDVIEYRKLFALKI
ncbi:MAG: tetratricopeptide repeat protein [Candidatus Heimdallarchaeota archaeon]|nr:tetratricopeptide repeat protein [Candidatus Heimdallarchaeota archaeon]MBY8994430.1 tetratricopeptide repeat protein [Candidatus Heimdallarchaeota archaeon]